MTMSLLRTTADPVTLRLNRDLTRVLKRGNPWVYADALRDLPQAVPGTRAVLLDNRKGQPVAAGFYDPGSPLAFRVCDPEGKTRLDTRWAESRLAAALALRETIRPPETTGFRLINGEGDGAPGLVIDVYGQAAVLKCDGAGPEGFWNAPGIAEWLVASGYPIVYERRKQRGREGQILAGPEPAGPVEFLERGLRFTADIQHGQKTGFFLDQRDNRHWVRQCARGRSVLNLFAYTGGFSIAAGCGGASHVTTVDLADPAVAAAREHWSRNALPDTAHEAVTADAFEFLERAANDRRRWDLVILDPPSFAPNAQSVLKARAAYESLIAGGARVTSRGGLLAAASCSSHIDQTLFLELCEEGISAARRRGTVLAVQGQPADHPSPLALPEFRYLKFVALRID